MKAFMAALDSMGLDPLQVGDFEPSPSQYESILTTPQALGTMETLIVGDHGTKPRMSSTLRLPPG